MELSSQILSDTIVYSKYARFIEKEKRRETWEEIVTRNKEMHIRKFPFLQDQIEDAYKYVYDKKVLPSMRSLQFGGRAIELNPARSFNCSFRAVDSWDAFHEIKFLLLSGCGVGYSVQKQHINQLPEVRGPYRRKKKRHLINDSIEGWADAVKVLVESYFFHKSEVDFDYRDIRPKGTPLKTSGGLAPGPQPLKDCIHNIRKVFDTALAQRGENIKLTSLEVHDIICHIADAVLAGGVRRSALIALFNIDDDDMLTCKYGNWYETNPQRGRANNSAVILRHKIDKKKFNELFIKIKASGCGEPGLSLSSDTNMGFNPCHEVSLKNKQFCNLTSINANSIKSQKELERRVRAAAFIGTLQASYTDFHYLSEDWQKNCEHEALLGISITGIANKSFLKLNLKRAIGQAKKENQAVAKLIKINPAARISCTKPEGTASLVVGTSSGIHAWHAPYYIRRITLDKMEPIYHYLSKKVPKLLEDDTLRPNQYAYLCMPIKAPTGAIFRDEGAMALLERVKHVYKNWVKPGHVKGNNTHNVSTTIEIKPEEWDEVREWMWRNRNYYTGLAVLPFNGGTYNHLPHEEINEETYEKLLKYLCEIDLKEVHETTDNTDLKGQVACAGGACSVL